MTLAKLALIIVALLHIPFQFDAALILIFSIEPVIYGHFKAYYADGRAVLQVNRAESFRRGYTKVQ